MYITLYVFDNERQILICSPFSEQHLCVSSGGIYSHLDVFPAHTTRLTFSERRREENAGWTREILF
jgi:hypothetical protein